MKDILKSQLEAYKLDNTKDSKKAIRDSLDSLKGSTIGGKATKLVEDAKETLNSTTAVKSRVIDSIEAVIDNLN